MLQVAHYFPRDYNVYGSSLTSSQPGSLVSVKAEVDDHVILVKRGLCVVKTFATTQEGIPLECTSFFAGFRGSYAANNLSNMHPKGTMVVVRGKLKGFSNDGEEFLTEIKQSMSPYHKSCLVTGHG